MFAATCWARTGVPGIPSTACGCGHSFTRQPRFHIERITAWLAGQSEGNRNQALFWAGCRLAEHGVALSDALGALTPAATTAGLSGREINRTLRSAYRTATPRLPTITTPLDAPGRDGGTSR